MDVELDLFSMIADEAQYEPVEDMPPIENAEDLFEDICIERDINLCPDDLTVIRALLVLENPADEDSAMEKAEDFAESLMEGKFDIYEDKPEDIDKFTNYAKERIRSIFHQVWEILVDIQEMLGDGKINFYIHPGESIAEYAAYLYNLNAPFHKKEPIPYQELTKVFQELIYNN